MSFEEIYSFIEENPICTLATIDGDQPRARGFFSLFFGDDKIYFTTAATKKVYQQISKNPKVELCYYSQNYGRMLRITTEVEEVDDGAKKEQLIKEKPYLVGFGADDPDFKLLRISHGKAHFWTLKDNLNEEKIPIIEF